MSAPALAAASSTPIGFEVLGDPVPQGSHSAFVVKGRAVVTNRGGARLGSWRAQIAATAGELVDEPLAGPVEMHLRFTLTRPKSHYRAGKVERGLRDDAAEYVAHRPDLDKLVRAVLDALTGVAFADDGQVAVLVAEKHYGTRAGVRVDLAPLEARS